MMALANSLAIYINGFFITKVLRNRKAVYLIPVISLVYQECKVNLNYSF